MKIYDDENAKINAPKIVDIAPLKIGPPAM
jgi:hypothetical protein